jgi:hypothetical protein
VPDGERLVQIFQRIVVLSEIVIDFADVVERVGFPGARREGAPQRQRLIEQGESLVFLTKIGVDAAHGVQGRGLAEQARILLLNGQRLIQVIERFFELARAVVEGAKIVELRDLLANVLAGARLSQILLMLCDLCSQRTGLRRRRCGDKCNWENRRKANCAQAKPVNAGWARWAGWFHGLHSHQGWAFAVAGGGVRRAKSASAELRFMTGCWCMPCDETLCETCCATEA